MSINNKDAEDRYDQAYTVIYFRLIKELGVSVTEVVIISLIFNLSKNTGWCYMSKQTMSSLFGMTRAGVIKAINRIVRLGYLERNDKGCLKLTAEAQKIVETVNFVDRDSKLSLLSDVNLVSADSKITLHNNKSKKKIKNEMKESYTEDFPSEKSSFRTLSDNPLFNTVENLYPALKLLYNTYSQLSENKINDLVQEAMSYLITRSKKQYKDHFLFIKIWIERNADKVNNHKRFNEKPLSEEEIYSFASMLVSIYQNLTDPLANLSEFNNFDNEIQQRT